MKHFLLLPTRASAVLRKAHKFVGLKVKWQRELQNHKLALRIIVFYFMSLHKYSENLVTIFEIQSYNPNTLYNDLTASKHRTTAWYLYSESRRLLCRLVRIIMSSVQSAVIHYYRQDYLRSIIPSTELKS